MKYLMHSTVSLFEKLTYDDALEIKNANIGSMVHQYSLCNTILTENDTVDFTNLLKLSNPIEFAHEVNEKYDCVVFSLGDFFRSDLLKNKKFVNINLFLKNLKTKTLAVGIGCRRRYWQSVSEFINTGNMGNLIKEFISENLKHSNIIGIRGYDTAHILNELGFIENKDYIVCGCPSLFLHGDKLIIPEEIKPLNKDIKIALNRNFNVNHIWPYSYVFYHDILNKYVNSNTIFTWFYEALNIHDETDKYGSGVIKLKNEDYNRLNYKYCFNIHDYFKLLSDYDICIGERLHGCAAAIAMGVPTIVICTDYRMEEVCNYHNIPYISIKNMIPNFSIENIIPNINFNLMHKKHSINFEKYLSFFEQNNIPTNFDTIRDNEETFFKILNK